MPLTFEERVARMFDQENPLPKEERVTVKEVLSSPDASILIPKVITGVMREAAEPNYIGAQFMQRVQLTEGRSIVIPSVGEMRAHDIPEGAPYPEESADFQLHRAMGEIKVGKTGLMVRVTDEMVDDSQWDVIALLLRKAGRAMARLKEEKIFNTWSRYGHPVFDNSLKNQYPEARTTGRGFDGSFNDTLSLEDIIDLFVVNMANGYTPTDILMHPLCWMIFAKNDILGSLSFGALGGTPGTFQFSPNSVQGRLPLPFQVHFSPFIPFDKVNKTFDLYVVDRNEVGILVVKDDLSTEEWEIPERDIQAIKVRERYGVGVLNEGKAITLAKNVKFALSYPIPDRVVQLSSIPEPPNEV